MPPWVIAFDASLTLFLPALLLTVLHLRSLSKERPSPADRERWQQIRQQGYGRFVLRRGVLACGVPIALAIGLLSLAAALAWGQSAEARAFQSFAKVSVATKPGTGGDLASSETNVPKAWNWPAFGTCLGAAVLPGLLIGAYFGDRLWHLREQSCRT